MPSLHAVVELHEQGGQYWPQERRKHVHPNELRVHMTRTAMSVYQTHLEGHLTQSQSRVQTPSWAIRSRNAYREYEA